MTFSQNEFDAPYRRHVCFMYDSPIANMANETTTNERWCTVSYSRSELGISIHRLDGPRDVMIITRRCTFRLLANSSRLIEDILGPAIHSSSYRALPIIPIYTVPWQPLCRLISSIGHL